MLKYRLMLGPVMIAALLGVLWLDQWSEEAGHARAGLVIFTLLLIPGIIFAAREIARLFEAKNVPTDKRVLAASGIAGCISVYLTTLADELGWSQTVPPGVVISTLAIASLLLGILARCRHQQTDSTMQCGAAALFAFVYLGLMPGMLLSIRAEHSVWVLGAALLTTKSCDIGAYFTGRALGKHKLIAWLSPGKTWEGLIGGIALASAVSILTLTPQSMAGLSWWYALIVGIVFAVVGQGGDLLASMLKRDAAVKDSGQSIPGFGGVLDVIDSPLLVGVVAYWMLA